MTITPDSLATAAVAFAAFVGALFIGQSALPGKIRQGVAQEDGSRLSYKLTGLVCFLLATALVLASPWLGIRLGALATRLFWPLFVVANLFSAAVSGALFVAGRRQRARTGAPPQPLWLDLWVGPTRNPTWLGVDLKMFFYQPSLIGLGVLNAGFAFAQLEAHGTITTQMWLYQGFWWVYLLTHYLYEEFMLQTWDVIAENFGFMLVWGDIVYVPFLYSLCGWFLVDQTTSIGWPEAAALAALFGLSLWVFRGANHQKFRYKEDRSARIWGRPAESMDGRLLVSGFWGIGRKLNYTGEIGVYLAIALTTGTTSLVPYLLPAALCALLVQRAWRDEQRCARKYGELWVRYCARVRFRMFPFLY